MKSTIQISNETKRLISSFGVKGESYEDIIKRMYSFAVKEHFREFMKSAHDFVSLDEFENEIEKEWPKSK